MHINEILVGQNDYKYLKDNVKWLEMAERDYMQLMPSNIAQRFKEIYERYTKDYSHSVSCAKCLLHMTKVLAQLYHNKQEDYRKNDNRNKNKTQ